MAFNGFESYLRPLPLLMAFSVQWFGWFLKPLFGIQLLDNTFHILGAISCSE